MRRSPPVLARSESSSSPVRRLQVIWRSVLAVFFSKAFVSSGLGDRVATYPSRASAARASGSATDSRSPCAHRARDAEHDRARVDLRAARRLARRAAMSYSLAKDPSGASARRLGAFLSQAAAAARPRDERERAARRARARGDVG